MKVNAAAFRSAGAFVILFLVLGTMAAFAAYGHVQSRVAEGEEAYLSARLAVAQRTLSRLTKNQSPPVEASTRAALFLPSAPIGVAGAQFQDDLIARIVKAKGRPQSAEILVPGDDAQVQKLTVRLGMKISISGLRDILYDLEAGHPLLLVEQLEVQAANDTEQTGSRKRRASEPLLAVAMDVSGFMVK